MSQKSFKNFWVNIFDNFIISKSLFFIKKCSDFFDEQKNWLKVKKKR